MIKTGLRIAFTLIFMTALACGKSTTSKEGNAAARDTFTRKCAACHGQDGEGRPLGGLQVPSLKREEALNYTDDQLFERIYRGTSNMPSFKNTLTEEQIKGLVRLIREEIQGRKPSS
jgi:mono/diheme cytochrome c family protein